MPCRSKIFGSSSASPGGMGLPHKVQLWLKLPCQFSFQRKGVRISRASVELNDSNIRFSGHKSLIIQCAMNATLGAAPCIDAARDAGLVVSIGHTDANYEQARAAMARGARSATHVFNAMRFHHY